MKLEEIYTAPNDLPVHVGLKELVIFCNKHQIEIDQSFLSLADSLKKNTATNEEIDRVQLELLSTGNLFSAYSESSETEEKMKRIYQLLADMCFNLSTRLLAGQLLKTTATQKSMEV